MYTEIKPNSDFKDIIQSFWTIQTKASEAPSTINIVPDGCFDIVVHINELTRNDVVITGIWDQPITVSVPNNSNTVGCRFYPACIDVLLATTISSIRNQAVPLQQEMLKQVDNLTFELLFTSKAPQEIIDFLEAYLYILIEITKYEPNTFLNIIRKTDTSIPIKTISEEVGISDRHLSRKFNSLFGIRTKTYQSILRFIRAKELLTNTKQASIVHIAIECGYYDQAHFTKEFKKYSGETPKQFISNNV